ncbi:hypothetical protein CHS0354_012175 [Potamilus streckersoni]|uniref:Uncharacterized protein n=1 Tax=Potamilus streckersoni TaxID=2493646 RepID=A0AAE0VRN9_9BIVA|nr:hypothetical protein CHS0354_012175 [Potamilus streckersoni]
MSMSLLMDLSERKLPDDRGIEKSNKKKKHLEITQKIFAPRENERKMQKAEQASRNPEARYDRPSFRRKTCMSGSAQRPVGNIHMRKRYVSLYAQ